ASPSVQRRRNPPPSGAMGTRPRRPELPAPLGCPLSGGACRLACAAELDPAPKKPGIPRGSIPPPPQNFRSRKREYRSAIFPEIDDKPPGSFRKKSARGCMFMGNKQIKEIRFGKLGGSQSLFLSSRGARPFF